MNDPNITTGGCWCGATRFEASGTFTQGDRKLFESSPDVNWGFCPECGTSLTWEGRFWGKMIVEFHVSTLDNPEEHKPRKHWYDSQRLPWFEVADDLSRFHRNDIDAEPGL